MSGFPTGLLALALTLSLKGALVTILVTLILAASGRRLPPALRHGLWLLVFLRLLLPIVPTNPVSLLALSPTLSLGETELLPGLGAEVLGSAPSGPSAAPGTPRPGSDPRLSPAGSIAVGIWFLGFAILSTRRLTASVQLRRLLRSARPVTGKPALHLLQEARKSLKIRRIVALLETPRLEGPAVVGWLRPRIVLPRGLTRELDRHALRHVLLHELAHVRRLDEPVRSLAHMAAALHWFNPFAWYALQRLDEECETACDALVLDRPSERDRTAYGHTLIAIAARSHLATDLARAPALGLSRKRHLQRRILMITQYRRPSLRRALACALLVLAVALIGLTDAPATADPVPADSSAEPAPNPEEIARAKETLTRMRNAGTAIFSWVTDAVSGQKWPVDAGDETDGGSEGESVDWTRCQKIGHEELEELLVPKYIATLPATDAWGYPLEFCLDRNPTPGEQPLAGIRSAGLDGEFDGSTYQPGAFSTGTLDQDLVWLDGFFIAWPEDDTE